MEQSEFVPVIDPIKCMGCGLCVKLCPTNALAIAGDLPFVADPLACDYSGVCQEICPTQAISLLFELVW